MKNIPTLLKELDNAFLKWCYLECKRYNWQPSDHILVMLFSARAYGDREKLKELKSRLGNAVRE